MKSIYYRTHPLDGGTLTTSEAVDLACTEGWSFPVRTSRMRHLTEKFFIDRSRLPPVDMAGIRARLRQIVPWAPTYELALQAAGLWTDMLDEAFAAEEKWIERAINKNNVDLTQLCGRP